VEKTVPMSVYAEKISEGVIRSVTATKVRIALKKRHLTSEGCKNCRLCSTQPPPPIEFSIRCHRTNQYTPGDTVRITRRVPQPLIAAFSVFGIPLLCVLLSLILWLLVSPGSINSTGAVMTSLASFTFGIILVFTIDLIYQKRYPPTIVSLRDTEPEHE